MRKCLSGSLLLLLLLFRISVSAFAAEAAGVDIPVVIDGGGTAYMIPEVNSPLPTDNAIRVDNGRTGDRTGEGRRDAVRDGRDQQPSERDKNRPDTVP